MKTIPCVVLLVLALTSSASAQQQQSAPPAPPTNGPEPTLPTELRLERENLLLQARINELEVQLAQLRSQVVNDKIGQRVPELVEKLRKVAPEWDVDASTLQLTPKRVAVTPPVAPAAPAAAAPTRPPAAPQP